MADPKTTSIEEEETKGSEFTNLGSLDS